MESKEETMYEIATKMEEASTIERFKLLGLPIRWEIVKILRSAGGVGMTHGEICVGLGKHLGAWPQLQRLAAAGLIKKEQYDARDVRYILNEEAFSAMMKVLEGFVS